MWRYDCPKSHGPATTVTGSECTSSSVNEHHVESLALEVIGQNWSGEMVALFLEDWQVARVALSCHVARDLLCQEIQESVQREPTVAVFGSLSHLASAVTVWRGVW